VVNIPYSQLKIIGSKKEESNSFDFIETYKNGKSIKYVNNQK